MNETTNGAQAAGVLSGAVKLGGHVLAERFFRRTDAEIPMKADEVDAAWLTKVLASGHPGAEVESFDIAEATSGTTSRWKATVRYNDVGRAAQLPVHLFAKTTLTFTQRLTQYLAHALPGEPGFFQHLRPVLDIEAPHGYLGTADVRTGRSITLLEDVGVTRQARFCTPLDRVTHEQMQDLLGNMARWHGHYWESPELVARDWLKTPGAHFRNFDRLLGMRKRARVGLRRAPELVPESLPPVQDKLYEACGRSLRIAEESPHTLLHGDPHIGNAYVCADNSMGFTDWQLVMRGSWAFDVAYTITSGLQVEDRRAWERQLIAFYIDRLHAGGGPALTFDTAWLAYRQQCLYPYFAWMITIGRSALMPEFQPDEICRAIVHRTATAIMDLDALGAVNG
ncbi:phosphotransferase [Nocardia cyriacigeorgica]|uniref:Phosphotransferase n=1 Tax=Nocardia cyriacigeorgica TaxID=135487 RepID=A0A6P1DD28_9NOCA|nr:phosphotransferase [Nocardia cyriacigeorgica]NEW39839.1 phosphotransferase [Nocardia cyriacigeorgica]NEW46302.1 phosphotransferase [Nocardia cyriacigeorgica]NEW52474.1 phosphotransferase [Nocardia cyriacigeorgica]